MAKRFDTNLAKLGRSAHKRLWIFFVLVLAMSWSVSAGAATKFISQNGGTFFGGATCNGQTTVSVAKFNSQTPSAGDTIYFCGAITSALQVNAGGAPGNVISFIADSGASIQLQGTLSTCPIVVNDHSYLLFDGGGAGGTNGILSVLNNGSGLTTQNMVSAFCLTNSDGNLEIKNWMLGPFYQHTSMSDTTPNADSNTEVFYSPGLSGDLSIHDNVIHDVGWAIAIMAAIKGNPTISIYNNYIYNMDWGVGFAPASGGAHTLLIHDNHFGSMKNWDTSTDVFHHDSIHFYEGDGPNSTLTAIYNNLFDGDQGKCCTTAFIFHEPGAPGSYIANEYIYNNVFNQFAGNFFPLVESVASGPGAVYNNTFQCGGPPTDNIVALTYGYPPGAGAPIFPNFSIENNVFAGCNTFMYWGSAKLGAGWVVDYNVYLSQGAGGNNAWWDTNTFSAWKQKCSCDTHSTYSATNTLNANGTPQVGSPAITGGRNLAGLGIAPLNSGTTAGNTVTSQPRPSLGVSPVWPAGAFAFGAIANQPAPPAGLTAIVN